MTTFSGPDSVREVLGDIDGWLDQEVAAYLLGGTALTIAGIQPQTNDLDLALSTAGAHERLKRVLTDHDFEVDRTLTSASLGRGESVALVAPEAGIEVDLFDRQILGKARLTEAMRERASQFWSGEYVTAFRLADEDLFLLKLISGGSPVAGRERDLADARRLQARGLDWDALAAEVARQRPFNTGDLEGQQLRAPTTHPLPSLRRAIQQLGGVPDPFERTVMEATAETDTERAVLQALDGGTTARDELLTIATAKGEAESSADASEAIDRLSEKDLITVDGDEVGLV
jgi:hypothetical protein